MVNVNDFSGLTDSEMINAAIANRDADRIVVIPPRSSDIEPEREYWLLDSAILLPANTTVILQNCTIKLSDACRDNFFRSANCGMGIEYPERIENIHIRGEGLCTLLGADHPRAVGDSSKLLKNPCPYTDEDICKYADWIPEERRLAKQITFDDKHDYSYGTDAGKEDESQYGDWRGIGVLLANVDHFSISNLKIVESHGWGISLEACANGTVEKIEFDARMHKEIDGMLHNMENEDGVDLRIGCHHITISDISGRTGDDLVALTAIADPKFHPGGSLKCTEVMHNDWTKRETGIHDIIIRNIRGYSQLCHIVRLLACNTKIWNVVIDGVIDAPPEGLNHSSTIRIGEQLDSLYGKNLTDGISHITISNVVCQSRKAIYVGGYLQDSVISNVINYNPECPTIGVCREDGLKNVQLCNIL